VIELNHRKSAVSQPATEFANQRKRTHVLVEFPHPELESIVVQWEYFRPTVLVQLKRNPAEPLQFPGKRTDMQAPEGAPRGDAAELNQTLRNFLDAATGLPFTEEAFLADIVFSARAFALLQPEPDLVLPAQDLWEARTEALSALKLLDAPLSESKAESKN
jgi:hypothetical protein